MQFEVNEQNYFLDFIPEEGRWFVLKPTRSGVEVVPVVDDDAPASEDELAVPLDTEVVN
jgi:hypothetical protein